jgi:electron transfer flavoprotein alpha subunit
MNVLVYCEGWSGAPDQHALGVLSKAFSLGEPATAVVCGGAAEEFVPVLASNGARRVLVVQDRSFAEPVYTSRVDALEMICRRHDIDVLLFPTTALTVDIAASLAMRLEAGLCWGLVDVEIADGDLIGTRLISGQMQHQVGMENSGTIIAINRDGGAPIMSFCDLAVVAELESVDHA